MIQDGRSLRAIKVSIFIFIVSCIIIRSTVTVKHEDRVWFFLRQKQQPGERGYVCQGDLKNLSKVSFSGYGLHGLELGHEFELDRRGRVPRFVSNVSPDCIKSVAVPRGNGSAVVMLALATENQIDFLENWVLNVKKAGIPMAVVGAGDEATFAKARELQVSVFRWSPEIQGGFADWGSAVWIMNTWQKVFAVQKIVSWGFDVILSDLDVVWWRDPSIIFDRHPNADMFFSHDGVGTTNTEEDVNKTLLELRASIHYTINTGMYMVRSTPSSRAFMRVWAARYPEFQGHDQNGIYDIIKVGSGTERHPDDPGVMKSANGSLYHAVLPTYVFANGHSYFVSKLHTVMHADIPFGMHATWTYDRSEGKVSRLREIKAWHDPPEYYDGKFVTVDLQVPPMPIGHNENTDTESMLQFHIFALEAQLQQVALGMIFSWSTGRTFIMPTLVCFCEKIWYAVIECRFPDFPDMQFPTPCPMDYYFSLETLNKGAYGIKMDFKEQGFLDNPRVSQAIKGSTIDVSVGPDSSCSRCLDDDGTKDCLKTHHCVTSDTRVTLPENLTDVQIFNHLSHLNDTKIWRVRLGDFPGFDARRAFGGFESPETSDAFRKFFDLIVQDWCCRLPEDASRLNKSKNEPIRVLPWLS